MRLGLIKAILLPPPLATLQTLAAGLAGGPLLARLRRHGGRTLQAFLIAAVVGVPLGVLLGATSAPIAASSS